MKSIAYKLFGVPQNLEDCISFLKENDVQDISLKLKEELFGDECPLVQFFAFFEFKVPKRTIVYSELCGGFLYESPEEKITMSVRRANQHLEKVISEICKSGHKIQNASQHFGAMTFGQGG
ncbi:MAG TPA: hypothetical protein PK821_00030 [Victivallales bacterium]|nr:hypothetical protein [Victivallales bacterium]